MATIAEMAVEVLTTGEGREKTALGRRRASAWFAARAAGAPLAIGRTTPPLRPARPERPELPDPRGVHAAARAVRRGALPCCTPSRISR